MPHVLQIALKASIEGGEVVLMHLARGLRVHGYTVTVAAAEPGPLLERMTDEGFPTATFPLRHIWDRSSVHVLGRFLDAQKIDLVQTHGKVLNILARRALRHATRDVHSIATEHNPLRLAHGGMTPGAANWFKSQIYRWIDNGTSARSARIVCVSNPVRQDKIEQGIDPDRLVVIENGIDLSRFAPVSEETRNALRATLEIPSGAPVVGTVARMDRQKAVDRLVQAMPSVWAHAPEAHLLLVGDGSERAALETLSQSLDPDMRRIRFLGFRQDVPRLLQLMDVFCLPSRWEGQPLALMEAMASGCAPVCTPVPGSLTLVEDGRTGRVVPFDDPDAMGQTIGALLSAAEGCSRIANAAREEAHQRFGLEAMVRRTVALYTAVGCPPAATDQGAR